MSKNQEKDLPIATKVQSENSRSGLRQSRTNIPIYITTPTEPKSIRSNEKATNFLSGIKMKKEERSTTAGVQPSTSPNNNPLVTITPPEKPPEKPPPSSKSTISNKSSEDRPKIIDDPEKRAKFL